MAIAAAVLLPVLLLPAVTSPKETGARSSISAWLQLSREANQVAAHSEHSSESGPRARRPAMHEGAPPRCISG